MAGRMAVAGLLTTTAVLAAGCGGTVAGTPTWPGAVLEKALLGSADFPAGVLYDRIIEQPGRPDGADGPGSMLSRPQGCANALTNVIKGSAERGPGSAAKYAVGYDGARMVMTLLSWNLDLKALAAEAARCAKFEAFFDPTSRGIPMTTAQLPGLEDGALAYQQTMNLNASPSSVYMAFQNVGSRAVFGVAFPGANPKLQAKAALPQTFLDVFAKQAAKLRGS
ncbi:MAG: hypothetical protein ACR2JM_07225 [Mycobacterium sp.]